MELNEKERIDDLQYKGLKIIQNTEGFCFGMDSVLLAEFARNIKEGSKVVDLGTGTGILSILLCGKTKLSHITGIEIQEEVAKMAQRSSLLNQLQDRFDVICDNIKDIVIHKKIEKNSIDVIVINPPYKKKDTGKVNESEKKIISRHEMTANLSDFIQVSKDLLKDNGVIYMVHRPERLVDIFYLLRENRIEPKEIQFVHSYQDKEPKLVLIKAVKYGSSFLKIHKPWYIYQENGEYTSEIKKIYEEKEK